MKIAGFKKQSLIDYPGHICSVVFTRGCNFRCPFCHNPDLVLPEKFGPLYDEDEILGYIKNYSKLLDAVCITGGEPTLHKDLPSFMEKIKETGLKIKLDTNGTNPEILKTLFRNRTVDFVAMDIKHTLNLNNYNKAVGNVINSNVFMKIEESIVLIRNSGIEHQFRTTVMKGLHTIGDIENLKKKFKNNYCIQNFNPNVVLDPQIQFNPFSKEELYEIYDK